MKKISDGRIARLWYPKPRIDRGTVNQKDWNKIKSSPYVLLVRAPLTFGHSQLVFTSPNRSIRNEKDFFFSASEIIKTLLGAFQKAFKEQEIHKHENYRALAVLTRTTGPYVKTLILRSSACENTCEEYKVHLVPFFYSHDTECAKRYRSIHGITSNDKGGLLGWLGQRETEVDKLFELGPLQDKLDDFANQDLNMSALAIKLRGLY